MIDFHNMRSMPAGMAAFLALTAPVPAVATLAIRLAAPDLFAAAGEIWILAGLALLTCAHAAALGWFMGVRVDRPLRHWADIADRLTKRDLVVTIPFATHKGALGVMSRHVIARVDLVIEADGKAQAQARRQTEAVASMAKGLSELAAGNLSHRLTEDIPEMYQQVKDDFNLAMERLQEAMITLKLSALGVRASTEEISRSAENLSRRTEGQAASLEETAAALDQITQTVRRTADAASEAKTVVLTATSEAQDSERVVSDAVSAMSEIERSAQQISQIIGVIDEIAFQTNLLALNAGVEAARAGEAGRGFAVVASEVRALAQRSAGAAKEIKALISTSTSQVTSGVQLVGQTGQALTRILAKVAEINSLVANIAGSAEDQALGLHEINSSINQMDHVTQQNAAMVEESTAACL
ncbi:MAG: mcpA, partial [Phenylobacterium sp.]|nr:mcpA [Phenylobacterium sp.]